MLWGGFDVSNFIREEQGEPKYILFYMTNFILNSSR